MESDLQTQGMNIRREAGHVGEFAVGLNIPLRIAFAFPTSVDYDVLISRVLQPRRDQFQSVGANCRVIHV
jgi:hypothetical protein